MIFKLEVTTDDETFTYETDVLDHAVMWLSSKRFTEMYLRELTKDIKF